jgi:plastocyanin
LVLLVLGPAWAAAATVTVQVVNDAGKPLVNAAVFLESKEARAAARGLKGVEVQQVDKRFDPLVTVVSIGTEVLFPNRDKVRHHVYSFSPPKPFELKLYAGTPANPVLFDKPGIVVLGCNIHDKMMAWVVVVETPYLGLTGASGAISLRDVPAGAYRLRVWHPELPPGGAAFDTALSVAGAAASANVRLPVAGR